MSPGSATILVVDDEPSVRKLLRRCFEAELYKVLDANSGAEMFASLDSQPIDLITLDLTLGDEDGLELARQIRSRSSVPIIMVSGKGELIDKVVGLEVGADDYISKPFELREVLARVRSLLRRVRTTADGANAQANATSTDTPQSAFCFGEWTLTPLNRELTSHAGQHCELTTNEFDLLAIFVRHPHLVLSRDQIMDQLKGQDWHPTDRSIDNQVARLRKKLERHHTASIIKTIRGVGYMFTAEVTKS